MFFTADIDVTMLSSEDIAAVKVAIEICNKMEIKREIFCMPGSDYDRNQQTADCTRKKCWDDIVERKASKIINNLDLPRKVEEKVTGLVLSIGMHILIWAKYYEAAIGLSRESSITFLDSFYFTQNGTIDNKKVAKKLLKHASLSAEQKYKLACLFCFTQYIPVLFKKMTKAEKEMFYCAHTEKNIQQPELVKFWSYYIMGDEDKVKGDKARDEYRLETAIQSGSVAAVEYCIGKPNLKSKRDIEIDAAVETVKSKLRIVNDWVVFNDEITQEWIPNDYYVEILLFLLSKMREEQQRAFLEEDVKYDQYVECTSEEMRRSRTLEYFLSWPYQNCFMKMARLMWKFLPENNFAVLLLKICDKIELNKGNLKYGEEKSYDYRRLLKEFWCQSPIHYKRHIFTNQEVVYKTDEINEIEAGVGVLSKLMNLNHFTCKDETNVAIILSSAKDGEIWNIVSCANWRSFVIGMIKDEKWEILNNSKLNSLLYKEKEDAFRRVVCHEEEAQLACINFAKNNNWHAAESFIKWSLLPEGEKRNLKEKMINSRNGAQACADLVLQENGMKVADKFCEWCLSSEKQIKDYKNKIIFSYIGEQTCMDLVKKNSIELADRYVHWWLSSEEEIMKFKMKICNRKGSEYCRNVILKYEEIYIWNKMHFEKNYIFKENRYEEVEQFLTWCFASEEELRKFKKDKILKEWGAAIHFKLIECHKWEEAEIFLGWLELSAEEVKELKKRSLFEHGAAMCMFRELMDSEEGDKICTKYVCKEEAIELFLRWYIADKETALEFKNKFKENNLLRGKKTDAVKEKFDLMIEQRINDLDREQRGKRKQDSIEH